MVLHGGGREVKIMMDREYSKKGKEGKIGKAIARYDCLLCYIHTYTPPSERNVVTSFYIEVSYEYDTEFTFEKRALSTVKIVGGKVTRCRYKCTSTFIWRNLELIGFTQTRIQYASVHSALYMGEQLDEERDVKRI